MLLLIATICFIACKPQQTNNVDPDFDGIFTHQKPADIIPVLEVYEWATAAEDSIDFEEFILKLVPECKRFMRETIYDEEFESNWFINLTDTVSLSCGHMICMNDELSRREEFMLDAEDLYNSSLVLRNLGSLYEVWLRNELLLEDARKWDSKQIMEAIRNLNVDLLEEHSFGDVINECRDSVLKYMDMGIDAWNDTPYPVLLINDMDVYMDRMFERFFDYYSTDDAVIDTTAIEKKDSILAGERFKRYKDAEDDEQLGIMLRELAECEDFDEQCALWRLWTNCKESMYEDDWIIAVGTRLMDSGEYNPYMNWIWIIWRALFQGQFCGMSKDSIIPNDFYNEYRKKCYKSYINHIIQHPEDRTGMKWAKILVELPNMNRMYGWSGNNALYEQATLLPARLE